MKKPLELLKATRLLEIRTKMLVDSIISGQYKSAFRGQGMTFSDFREYVAGDDVRHISWPLMARTGKPFIKKFDEERELQILLIVDISGSTTFGSGLFSKRDKLVHVAATLALSAAKNGDEVGCVLFSDFMEHYLPPKKGRGAIQRLLRDLAFFEPKHSGTRLASAIEFLRGVLKKKSIIFILSDFTSGWDPKALRELSKKHDVVACVMDDDFDSQLPDLGLIEMMDAESEEQLLVDTSSASFKNYLNDVNKKAYADRDRNLKASQVQVISLSNQKDFYLPIVQFFEKRRGRR